MTFGELVDRVIAVTGLPPQDAARVASEIFGGEAAYTEVGIRTTAEMLGLSTHPRAKRTLEGVLTEALHELQLEGDPANVLAAVYRDCPRMLPKRAGDERVHLPRIGKAPKDSAFYDEDSELRQMVEDLPEEVRLLIGAIDVHRGELTLTLYDEANDVDRHVGPIDLSRFQSADAFQRAIGVLLGRLPRVLASDWN